jgi:uncharacterized membrane protein YdjX (TVP38/TMEM64 family)
MTIRIPILPQDIANYLAGKSNGEVTAFYAQCLRNGAHQSR